MHLDNETIDYLWMRLKQEIQKNEEAQARIAELESRLTKLAAAASAAWYHLQDGEWPEESREEEKEDRRYVLRLLRAAREVAPPSSAGEGE